MKERVGDEKLIIIIIIITTTTTSVTVRGITVILLILYGTKVCGKL